MSFIYADPCDDGSSAPCYRGAPSGGRPADKFLSSTVPQIMNSAAYKQSGLILITFAQAPQTGNDADNSSCCDNPTTYPNVPADADRDDTDHDDTTRPQRRRPRRHRRTTTPATTTRRPDDDDPVRPPWRHLVLLDLRHDHRHDHLDDDHADDDLDDRLSTTTTASTSTTGTCTTTTPTTTTGTGTTTTPTTTTDTGTTTTPTTTTGTSTTPTTTTPSTTTTTPCTAPAGGQVGLLAISQYITPGSGDYLDSFNHFSLLGSIEQLFGLKRLGYAATGQLPLFGSSFYSDYTPA